MKRVKIEKASFYPVHIEPCEEGGFFASCSMLQGCHADGETYGETIDNITEVIKAHLAIREENNEIIPSISIKDNSKFSFNLQIPIPFFT